MIVDGKVRKMKFSEKVRDNLERFKDRIEGLGKKVVIGGMLLGGVVGCVSDGNNRSGNNYYADPLEEWYMQRAEQMWNIRRRLYSDCISKEDSIKRTKEIWKNATGSEDPKVWLRVVAKEDNNYNAFATGYYLDPIELWVVVTYPYADSIAKR